ncbi:hypothetical protein HMPREF3201_00034 [Megasphaera sp. MJR8396C]|nr:hypothetical protein HMPREF3201_00034 [Megasphaera sp. MJR8396C]
MCLNGPYYFASKILIMEDKWDGYSFFKNGISWFSSLFYFLA